MRHHIVLATLVALAAVRAASVDYSLQIKLEEFRSQAEPYNFTFSNLPEPTGAGVVEIEVKGDFSGEQENYDVYVDNFWYGTALNNDPLDDQIRNTTDMGSDSVACTAWVDLPLTTLLNMWADKTLVVRVDPSSNVNDMGVGEYIYVTLSYPAVPEPASLTLLAAGGYLVMRRRTKRA